MRTKVDGHPWPVIEMGEHTSTCFQIRHDPEFPKTKGLFMFEVGDKVITPLGKGELTWIDEENGNCLVLGIMTAEDRKFKIASTRDLDERRRIVYRWVAEGEMPMDEFLEYCEDAANDDFESGRQAGLDGQEGPES